MNSGWRNFCTQPDLKRLWILFGLGLFSSSLAIAVLVTKQAITQYAPVATRSSNPWEYAPFPVKNFQAHTSGFGPRRTA